MNDLISREDAVKAVDEAFRMGDCYCDQWAIRGLLNGLPSVELKWGKGKCTKTNCPIQMNYISNDCDIKTCPYRTEYRSGKWKNIAFFTRECSECGAQFHELEYDNFCPNCGTKMEWDE